MLRVAPILASAHVGEQGSLGDKVDAEEEAKLSGRMTWRYEYID